MVPFDLYLCHMLTKIAVNHKQYKDKTKVLTDKVNDLDVLLRKVAVK